MKEYRDRFEEWLSNKGLSSRTLENYLYYFDGFIYDVFNQEKVALFLSEKKNSNIVARSFVKNFREFLIKNYVELGISEDYKLHIIAVELPRITGRAKVKVPIPIPFHMIDILESKLGDAKQKLQFRITYHCGLRSQELMRIRPIDFNWDEWKLDTTQAGTCMVAGKGNKPRLAIVPSFLMKMSAKYIRRNNIPIDEKIFFSKNTSGSLASRSRLWRRNLSDAGYLAGIVKKDGSGKAIEETRVHPHRLRHSFASHCADKGMPLNKIRDLLGHSSIQSTQIYLHTSKQELKKDVEDMNSL